MTECVCISGEMGGRVSRVSLPFTKESLEGNTGLPSSDKQAYPTHILTSIHIDTDIYTVTHTHTHTHLWSKDLDTLLPIQRQI